jgi:outer membrane protein OmpA-like peptidoglycan-associated protein
VQVLFAIVDFQIAEGITVEAVGKSIQHDVSNPGDATRAELGVRYVYNDRKDVGGLSMAIVSADQDENEYQEYRAFATYSPGRWRFSLDALTHRYKEEIGGIDDAYHVVGSAGVQVLPYMKVSGDVTYTRSPRFSHDYVGLLRVSIDLSGSTEDGLWGGSGKGEEETEAAAAVETPAVETAPSPETAPATPETELPAVASAPETVPAEPDTGLPAVASAPETVPATPGIELPAAGAAAGEVAAPPADLPAGGDIARTAEAPQPVPIAPSMPREEMQAKAVFDLDTYLDQMAAEIRAKFQDAIVGRRGEIVEFTLPSDLVFDVGSAVVTPAARESLATAAAILKRYPETLVTIEGHTDSMGMVESNQELSEKRARSVFDILVQNGVPPLRLSMRGYGERFPIADNATAEGRQVNRRVQMKIRPDSNLKSRQRQGG